MTNETMQEGTQDFDLMLGQIEQMIELLEREATLINRQNIEAIETLAAEKQSLALQLDKISTEQQWIFSNQSAHNEVSRHSDRPSQTDIDILVDPELTEQRSRIYDHLLQCRLLNEANGAAIELLRRHSQRCLEILTQSDKTTHTYGPNGITQNSLPSRSLILA